MKAKVEWFSTVLTIIVFAVGIASIIYNNFTVQEFLYRYKGIINTLIIPILIALFSTNLVSVFNTLNNSNRIYVSYCHKDKEVADQIIRFAKDSRNVKKNNIIITSDNDIKMGENIDKSIKKSISNAGTIIIVVSDKYISSKSCTKEFNYIVNERAKIIPVFLPSIETFDNIPTQIKEHKGVVLIQDTSEDIHKAVDTIIKDIT